MSKLVFAMKMTLAVVYKSSITNSHSLIFMWYSAYGFCSERPEKIERFDKPVNVRNFFLACHMTFVTSCLLSPNTREGTRV